MNGGVKVAGSQFHYSQLTMQASCSPNITRLDKRDITLTSQKHDIHKGAINYDNLPVGEELERMVQKLYRQL